MQKGFGGVKSMDPQSLPPLSHSLSLSLSLSAANVGYSFEKMQLLENELQRPDGSPTRCLLWDLGCMNYNVIDLYEKLNLAGRKKEMEILEKFGKICLLLSHNLYV